MTWGRILVVRPFFIAGWKKRLIVEDTLRLAIKNNPFILFSSRLVVSLHRL